mmetsp:Transcript_57514/g.168423  ORF Transcript_57514/g.168423 Transcript_57514/m.168423 type:complete len:357 (+) Transcript_57514:828-1898(+)
MQAESERTVDHRHDLALVLHTLLQFMLTDEPLGKRLQSEELAGLGVPLQAHGAEGAHAQEAHAVQGALAERGVQLELALAEGAPGLVAVGLLQPLQEPDEPGVAAALVAGEGEEVVLHGPPEVHVLREQASKLIERWAVQHQAPRALLRHDPHREVRGRLSQQGALAEVVYGPQRRQLLFLLVHRARHAALPSHQYVPHILKLALTHDPIAFFEGQGQEVLGKLQFLVGKEPLEDVHPVEVPRQALHPHLLLAVHDPPEGILINAPHDRVFPRNCCEGPWGVVEQRHLPKGVTLAAQPPAEACAPLVELVLRQGGCPVFSLVLLAVHALGRVGVNPDEAQVVDTPASAPYGRCAIH